LYRTAAGPILPAVDAEEADREAKRRWGPRASAGPVNPIGDLHPLFLAHEEGPGCTGLGQGTTWEAAFADAERREWKLAHPFNLRWRVYDGRLFLVAECSACRVVTEHRVAPQAPFTKPDWLQRAESAETSLVRRVQADDRWRGCPHRGGRVRPDREEVVRAARLTRKQ